MITIRRLSDGLYLHKNYANYPGWTREAIDIRLFRSPTVVQGLLEHYKKEYGYECRAFCDETCRLFEPAYTKPVEPEPLRPFIFQSEGKEERLTLTDALGQVRYRLDSNLPFVLKLEKRTKVI